MTTPVQTPIQRIQAKCKEVSETAKRLYDVDLSVCAIRFDLKGRVGGWASGKGLPNARQYAVRFNHDMALRETDEMVNDVVPHELAHIVCYMKRELGKNHDYGWARVCRALGGSGVRTHSMDAVYGKGTTYEYTTDRGHKVRLSDRHHAAVQQGRTLSYRKGKGKVSNACAYSIVGVQGRTLAAPIVRKDVADVPTPAPVPATPLVITPRVHVLVPANFNGGQSKAEVSRGLMLAGYRAGHAYEAIILAMIATNGYNRQLARATFKANAPRVGIPATFGG